MCQYKGKFVNPSYAVRLRTSKGGTARIINGNRRWAFCYTHYELEVLSSRQCVNRLNLSGYMTR